MSRVLALGNAGIDLSLTVPNLARPGETVVAETARRAPGGKGLNQAVTAARAGAVVTLRAAVGQDSDAEAIETALAREPLAWSPMPRPLPTDQSIVMVGPDGENSIVTIGLCADSVTEDEAAGFASDGGATDWLLLQGNLTAAATRAAMRAARCPVMLNAAPLRWQVPPLLPDCAVLVVNEVEAEAITGLADPRAAALWLRAQGCGTAIVTLGAAGCVWAESGGPFHLPAEAARAVDTSGAGDVFCGVLVAALAARIPLAPAITAAQSAAALSVTRVGAFAAIPTAAELAALTGG